MEQGQKVRFEIGKKYRKEEILQHFEEFHSVDFTEKRNGRPVLKVTIGDKMFEFIQDGRKYKLV